MNAENKIGIYNNNNINASSMVTALRKVSGFLAWLPMIANLILCAFVNESFIVLGVGLGLAVAIIILSAARKTILRDELAVFPHWIQVTNVVVQLALLLVRVAGYYGNHPRVEEYTNITYIGALNLTGISTSMLLSILVWFPFTNQNGREHLPDLMIRKPPFKRMHAIISGYITFILVVMTVCNWLGATALHDSRTARTILSTVVPIVGVFVFLSRFMQPIIAFSRKHAGWTAEDRMIILQWREEQYAIQQQAQTQKTEEEV